MDPLSSCQINQLRRDLGWSVREFGEFVGRSHQTIYNWEDETTDPDRCMRAFLTVLWQETRRHRRTDSAEEMAAWSRELRAQGAPAFISGLPEVEPASSPATIQLLRRSEREGGCTITPCGDGPGAFVLPLTRDGFRTFLGRVLGLKQAASISAVIEELIGNFCDEQTAEPLPAIDQQPAKAS